jgi:hypothetical protein
MKTFLNKHWFNVGTILIAIVALAISLQANLYAREANQITVRGTTASLNVFRNFSNYSTPITITGCFHMSGSLRQYILTQEVTEVFTIVNKGGLGASLIGIYFSEGGEDYKINLYDYDKNGYILEASEKNKRTLPIDIDAGKGIILLAKADQVTVGNTVSAVLLSNYPVLDSQEPQEIKKPAVWRLEFSDGTIILEEYKQGWYSINPYIDRSLNEDECNF